MCKLGGIATTQMLQNPRGATTQPGNAAGRWPRTLAGHRKRRRLPKVAENGGRILKKIVLRTSLVALTAALTATASATAWAQDSIPARTDEGQEAHQAEPTTVPEAREVSSEKREPAIDDDTISVTGSRLANGDPTARVTVITAKEIQARGVTSVDELIRTLPQNLATIGPITNDRSKGPLSKPSPGQASVSALGQLGVSAANLGGSGAGNTLILVNGRRVAGAAGIEDGFVNLNGIPLNAIERVEIDTSGVSAVYGADAIGGVINFVLKKNFTGTTLSAQHEFSSNAASSTRFNATSGVAWGSGSISATASYTHRNPINNYKTGYTTQNYSALFDGNPAFDLRNFTRGLQPGVIVFGDYVPNAAGDLVYVEKALSPRAGLTGRPSAGDFVELDPSAKRDYVPEFAGPKSNTISASVNIEQSITKKLTFFADGLYTRSKNSQISDYNTGLQVQLAPGQYYNPFPAYSFDSFTPGTAAYYFPQSEIATGALRSGTISNTQEQWSINAGLRYQLNRDTRIEFVFTTAKSKSKAKSTMLGSLVEIIEDPSSATGYSCYNFMLAENQYRGSNIDAFRQAYQRQCAALTSTDPATAFNPWKTSAKGSGADTSIFLYNDAQEDRQSQSKNYDLHMNGQLINLPAGPINYALGGEYYSDGVNSREVSQITGGAMSRDRYAVFGEMTIPVLAGRFTLPGFYSLILNVSARNDTYLTDGAIGTVDNVPVDRGGKIIFGHNRFSRTTPSLGVRWQPVRSLVVRGKWTKGFRAPPYTQLFSVIGTSTYNTTIINDPLYTCTTDCSVNRPGQRGYTVPITTAPNPNLRPQTSDQYNIGASWTPQGLFRGLSLNVTYNRTKIHDEYANRATLLSSMPVQETLKIAQFYPRDPATGKILASQNMIFNIAGSEYSSITYEASYLMHTDLGTFEPRITYLDNLKAERRVTPTSPIISTLGNVLGPDEYKIMGSLAWSRGDVNATLWAYYTPSYRNDYTVEMFGGVLNYLDQVRPVRSLTTFDLTGSWQIRDFLRLNVAGRNIFGAKPPFALVDSRPYDTARYNVAGRTLSVEMQVSF
ncbi:TonB-dependent receptor plug domain-containing protein [Sphingomonas sp. CJ20]